jgi:hypothetical protein
MPDRAAPDALAGIKKVGVVSLAAHELNRQYTGFTVFGNERETHDISSWRVDDEYESQMQAALTSLGPYQVVRLGSQRKELFGVYELSGADKLALRALNLPAVEDRLKAIAGKEGLDAIVMVVKRDADDFLAGSNQRLRGAGLYARGAGERTTISVMHLLASVILIDGRTGQPLANRMLSRTQEGMAGTINRASPIDKVGTELTRAKFTEAPEARRNEVRKQLAELPRSAWAPTFRALFAGGR